jgi:hypothetical protein
MINSLIKTEIQIKAIKYFLKNLENLHSIYVYQWD